MPATTKGLIVCRDDPTVSIAFMYNPTTIDDKKSAAWVATGVPHISHPAYQFGAGGARHISFELHHDGDRSSAVGAGLRDSNAPAGFDVSAWIQGWRAFLYPASAGSTISSSGSGALPSTSGYAYANPPSKVLFSFGPMWDNVLCIMTKCDFKANWFNPNLGIIRATVEIELEEAPDVLPIYANQVRGGVGY